MTFSSNAFVGLLALASCVTTASAVCPSNTTIAIGTPAANTATGLTQCTTKPPPPPTLSLTTTHPRIMADKEAPDKIYDNSCNTVQTLQIDTTIGVCDNRYFYCAFGTKNIEEYDDPTTGLSYLCSADATSESCSGDTVTYCVSSPPSSDDAVPGA